MNVDQLSKRLQVVASYVKDGMRVADIGSDHAYLPCYLVKQKIASSVIAGEVVEGPFRSAKTQVEASNLNHLIEVRKGDGLAVIGSGEVDCIIIAGMGGPLITSILDKGKNKLVQVQRLILQPNVGAKRIRQWLIENQWELVYEEILEEDEKIYEVLVADKGTPLRPYKNLQKELLLGPFLLKEKNEVFQKKWMLECEKWKKVLKHLEYAQSKQDIELKKQQFLEKISIVEEVLK